jgi:hypothetical protein
MASDSALPPDILRIFGVLRNLQPAAGICLGAKFKLQLAASNYWGESVIYAWLPTTVGGKA